MRIKRGMLRSNRASVGNAAFRETNRRVDQHLGADLAAVLGRGGAPVAQVDAALAVLLATLSPPGAPARCGRTSAPPPIVPVVAVGGFERKPLYSSSALSRRQRSELVAADTFGVTSIVHCVAIYAHTPTATG